MADVRNTQGAEEAESGQSPTDQFRDFVTAEVGPLLAGRDLTEGGSFVKACHEIAEALAPWVVPMAVKAAQRDRMVEREIGVIDRLRALVESPEAVQYRDEACRHVADQPYADNRYVRLLDAVREAIR